MRVLESFSGLGVSTHVKHCFSIESSPLYISVSEKVAYVSDISAVNLIVGW